MSDNWSVPASALAKRSDFILGNATIQPSRRTVDGPKAAAILQPRVMQVLLALNDARGEVLSREDLLEQCWASVLVGDDAINRTIAEIRRVIRETGADFKVETIPRIGYRIDLPCLPSDESVEPPTGDTANFRRPGGLDRLSRRTLIAGSAAATAIMGAGAFGYLSWRDRAEYLSNVEQARQGLDTPQGLAKSQALLEKLSADWPNRAEAWGLLAYVRYRYAEMAPFQKTGVMVSASEDAAARALAIDSNQSDALLAAAMLRFSLADWIDTEQRVRRVIALAPGNVEAIEFLVVLLQCVGRCRESRAWLDRAFEFEPMKPALFFKKALKHWIFGEVADADRIIDRALQLWPRNEWVWNTRLMIYAFTGRPLAAISMLEDSAHRPATMLPSTESVWRTALTALDTWSASNIAKARDTIRVSAPHGPANAGQGVMLLSALGELDTAYDIANGLLLARGSNVGTVQASMDGRLINSQSWRRTQWLFIPATAALRTDARFKELCEGLGLLNYWREGGVWPDKFVIGSLAAEVP